MSFICCIGNHQSQPGEHAVRVVVVTRDKEYPRRENAHRARSGPKFVRDEFDAREHSKDKEPRKSRYTPRKVELARRHDPGGKGFEIVREVLACASCANSLTQSA